MAYSYLLDLYQVLAERQAEILKAGEAPGAAVAEEQYRQGRLSANTDFLNFLKNNHHGKLPRRLQKH